MADCHYDFDPRFEALPPRSYWQAGPSSSTESDAEVSPVPSSIGSDFNGLSSGGHSESDCPSTSATTASAAASTSSSPVRTRDPSPVALVNPSWILPTSPPFPPLRYDPRCRASSPDTPSPLFAKWRQTFAGRHAASSDLHGTVETTQSQKSTEQNSFQAPDHISSLSLSRTTSFASSSAASTSSVLDGQKPDASHPVLSQLAHSIAGPSFSSQPAHSQNVVYVPQASTSTSAVAPHLQYQPSLNNTRSQAASSIRLQDQDAHLQQVSYSTAIAQQQRPGLAKLSRVREPTSSGRKRIKPLAKHAHKRSCSVQWQQFERWQAKSRARLRDLLILLVTMIIGSLVLWRFCHSAASSATNLHKSKRRASSMRYSIPRLVDLREPERDTVVLYRILGNDLPPRHGVGQTLRNLRFMLMNEDDFGSFSSPDFSPYAVKVEKYFVLNRITNSTAHQAILALFTEFGVPRDRILEIPFEWEKYRQREMRWDGGVTAKSNLWGIGQPSSGEGSAPASSMLAMQSDDADKAAKKEKKLLKTKLRAMEYATHDKNLYAINNNGGRNFALQHGQSLPHARWILPFDGNCFFTPHALADMVRTLATEGEARLDVRHVIVPMSRLLDNQDVVPANSITWTADDTLADLDLPDVSAPEEPQIGFRWDSPTTYQQAMRYGRRSKLELLWRLGAIPFNRGLHLKKLAWEREDHVHITPHSYASALNTTKPQKQTGFGVSNGDFVRAGWVYRLFSGEISQEESSAQAAELRRINRMKGIIGYLENLDHRAHEISDAQQTEKPSPLWHLDWTRLNAAKAELQAGRVHGQATFALESVKQLLVNTQDLIHHRSKQDWAFTDPQDTARKAFALALAGYLTSQAAYCNAAAQILQLRFLGAGAQQYRIPLNHDEASYQGYAFPASSAISYSGNAVAALPYDPFAFDPTYLIDATALFAQSTITAQDSLLQTLKAMLGSHLEALLLSEQGKHMSSHPATVETGLLYDSAVASLAMYLDLPVLFTRALSRHHLRYRTIEGEEMQLPASTMSMLELFRQRIEPSTRPDASDTPKHLNSPYEYLESLLLSFGNPDLH